MRDILNRSPFRFNRLELMPNEISDRINKMADIIKEAKRSPSSQADLTEILYSLSKKPSLGGFALSVIRINAAKKGQTM